jgi:hypothetical protein
VLSNYESLGGSAKVPASASTNCCGWNNVECTGFQKEICWTYSGFGVWQTLRVTEINWSNQNLRGSISPQIANLPELGTLILRDNAITDVLPDTLQQMTKLEQIDLGNNKLSGDIPSGIGNLRGLTRLSLTNNLFSGSIPSHIGNLTSLKSLELGKNQLAGSIPSSFQNLVALKNLELNDNFLSGTIPSAIGALQSLLTISLSGNTFSGSIPSVIGNLRSLTYLSLSQNLLSGAVPTQIGSLTKLQFLYLQGNSLTDAVPTEIGQMTQLRHLFLSNNFLSGGFPDQVGSLTRLVALRIEQNNLTGVPSSLSTLTQAKKVLLPNPMSLIPYNLVVENPSFTLLESDWQNLLLDGSMKKRQASSNTASLTTEQLYALCPLNDVRNPDVPAGCIAGIYKQYCADVSTEAKLAQCQSIYDQVFSVSIFKPIGDVCPAWKRGPRSFDCLNTIRNFKYELPYMMVTSEHAGNLTANILASQTYAPCYPVGRITCRW